MYTISRPQPSNHGERSAPDGIASLSRCQRASYANNGKLMFKMHTVLDYLTKNFDATSLVRAKHALL